MRLLIFLAILIPPALAAACGPRPAVETIEPKRVQVTDGDTIRIGAERIRVENIDAPELPGHQPHCAAEAAMALAARRAVLDAIHQARAVTIERHGLDRYRRTLALVRVDGRDLGEVLVGLHLAVRWEGHRHGAAWCEQPEAWDEP